MANQLENDEGVAPKDKVDFMEMRIREGVDCSNGLGALFNGVAAHHRRRKFFKPLAVAW